VRVCSALSVSEALSFVVGRGPIVDVAGAVTVVVAGTDCRLQLRSVQDSRAEEVEFRSAVHLAFDRFYAIHGTLDGAGAVRQGQSVDHDGEVGADATVEAVQVG
jgi:hypothetical protein